MLNISIENLANVVIIRLAGRFFFESADEIEEVWQRVVKSHPRIVAFDCADLENIDSVALGIFVKLNNQANERHFRLVFYDINSGIEHVMTVSRLNMLLTLTTREHFESNYLSQAGRN